MNNMNNKLPTKLGKEPLLEAVFEMRFSSRVPASTVLPGLFYEKLDGEKNIDQLPAASLPQQIRDTDPNLQYAPVVRVQWKDYFINIGDRSVGISCKLPYVGWSKFKGAIIEVMTVLQTIGTIQDVQRYSLKYVDLIPVIGNKEQVEAISLKVNLGSHKLEKEIFQFRIEIPVDEVIHVIQIISSAVVTNREGVTKQGLIVDIDSICNIGKKNLSDVINGFEKKLDFVHQKNKEIFFDCLTLNTLKILEPSYE